MLGTAWFLSDYSVSGQQAEPSGAQRTLRPATTTSDHQIGISSSTGALIKSATSLSISSGLSPLHSRM